MRRSIVTSLDSQNLRFLHFVPARCDSAHVMVSAHRQWRWVLFASLALVSCLDERTDDDPQHEPLKKRSAVYSGDPPANVFGVSLRATKALRRFYQARDFAPAWSRKSCEALHSALQSAEAHALHGKDYHGDMIASKLARTSAWSRELDLLCTDAFLSFAAHLSKGTIAPESIEPDWRAPHVELDLPSALARALDEGSIGASLERLAPTSYEYSRLKDALERYRAMTWTAVPSGVDWEGNPSTDALRALRTRLEAEGVSALQDSNVYEDGLREAVRQFQARHGLEETGIPGPKTLAALNVPAAERALQLEANLERLRWQPDSLGERYIVVNIPEFELRYVDAGREKLSMRVVVGKSNRRTPVFSGELFEVIVNPAWGVPRRIAIEDKLPKIKKDVDYLAANDIKIYQGETEIFPEDIDWTKIGKKNFPYRLRQGPGPRNALGSFKFNIDNEFDVYLHDTPERDGFAQAERNGSSGCIRLHAPVELASVLLGEAGWTRERLETLVQQGETTHLKVPRPILVHLVYRTAWIDAEGNVSFRRDIDGRDRRLVAALAKRRSE